MRRRQSNSRGSINSREKDKLIFRLYVTSEAPSSIRAMANLQAICQNYLGGRCEIEVVDTVQDPLRAMQDGIVLTPTLLKVAPEPRWSVVGDLGDDARVLAAMNANGRVHTESNVRKPQGGKNAGVKRGVGTSSSRTNRSTGSGASSTRQTRK